MSSVPASDARAHKQVESESEIANHAAMAWRCGPLVALPFLLMAGLATFLIVQAVHPVFWTTEGMDEYGFLPLDVQWRLDRNNAMLVLGLLGGLAGAAMAVAEGLSRRSWKTALAAGIGCATVGALFGGLAGYVGHRGFEFYKPNAEVTDLTKAICVYGMMLATLGGGVGLGAGAFLARDLRTTLRCILGGLLAGVLASVTYLLVVAMFLPNALTTVLLPLEAGERLLWIGLITSLLALILPAVARGGPANPKADTAAAGSPPPNENGCK
jgi:hypothetical protein